MGNTEAKLSAPPEQAKLDANYSTLKRRTSSPAPGTSNKRRAIAPEANDTGHTDDIPASLSDSNKPFEELRDCLDEDEQFLELPQLFDLVGVVAKKHGLDESLLIRNYRGQDALSHLKNRTGKWDISMSRASCFRPVTVVAKAVDIGDNIDHKQEIFVFGRGKGDDSEWLTVSYRLDTQLPHLVLRISMPSTEDASNDRENIYVNIFATNLSQSSKMPITMTTGKTVAIGRKLSKRIVST